jgi:hypothetical protein
MIVHVIMILIMIKNGLSRNPGGRVEFHAPACSHKELKEWPRKSQTLLFLSASRLESESVRVRRTLSHRGLYFSLRDLNSSRIAAKVDEIPSFFL